MIHGVSFGQNFSGKRNNVDTYIGLDDQTIRQVATLKTMQSIDTKKHKKLQTALDCTLPVAGGITAAAYASKGARLAAFGGGFTAWALFLTGMGAAFGIEKAIRKKSEKADNFAQKHPFVSFVASAGAAFAAGTLAIKGGAKGFKALAKTDVYKNVAKKAGELFGKVKANKVVANISEKAAQLSAKTPSALKEVGKFAARNATWIAIFGSIAHSLNHNSKVANEYNKNYSELKERQLELARRRNAELAVLNDVLLLDPEKREILEAMKPSKKS